MQCEPLFHSMEEESYEVSHRATAMSPYMKINKTWHWKIQAQACIWSFMSVILRSFLVFVSEFVDVPELF